MKNTSLYLILAVVVLYILISSYKKYQRTERPRDLIAVLISSVIIIGVAAMIMTML